MIYSSQKKFTKTGEQPLGYRTKTPKGIDVPTEGTYQTLLVSRKEETPAVIGMASPADRAPGEELPRCPAGDLPLSEQYQAGPAGIVAVVLSDLLGVGREHLVKDPIWKYREGCSTEGAENDGIGMRIKKGG